MELAIKLYNEVYNFLLSLNVSVFHCNIFFILKYVKVYGNRGDVCILTFMSTVRLPACLSASLSTVCLSAFIFFTFLYRHSVR